MFHANDEVREFAARALLVFGSTPIYAPMSSLTNSVRHATGVDHDSTVRRGSYPQRRSNLDGILPALAV
jgi:hypothetical protein